MDLDQKRLGVVSYKGVEYEIYDEREVLGAEIWEAMFKGGKWLIERGIQRGQEVQSKALNLAEQARAEIGSLRQTLVRTPGYRIYRGVLEGASIGAMYASMGDGNPVAAAKGAFEGFNHFRRAI